MDIPVIKESVDIPVIKESVDIPVIKQRAIDECRNFVATQDVNVLDDSFMIVKIQHRKLYIVRESSMKERQHAVVMFLTTVCEVYPQEINGTFIIGLHDCYDVATCAMANDLTGVLVFSRTEQTKGQILLPDMYAMSNYNGKLFMQDCMPFDRKFRSACFVGVTTGNTVASKNRRLQLCDWSRSRRGICVCYISSIVQMGYNDVLKAYPDAGMFYLNGNVDIPSQRQHQFLINMDGNTCAWDRLVWILASNSVCLKEQSKHMNWYYPLLEENVHYIPFDNFDEIERVVKNDDLDAQKYITAANEFVNKFLTFDKHIQYAGDVLFTLQEKL